MSIRGSKRVLVRGAEEAGGSKRRKTEQDELWQLRPVSDLKISSIYNRSASEAPAELFRKDLISAMKLPDSEPLTSQDYWIITDTWKQEWERGVQVPVNPDSLPAPAVQEIPNPLPDNFHEFKLPKTKYIHLARDPHYQPEIHQLSATVSRAEAACTYDLDATDSAWLKILNGERARAGAAPVTDDQLERVLQELEVRCWDKIQAIMKSEEGLGIEYDENVICDVCRSPDSEEGNEMVFCDACNICVHQACYGITAIPSGQWLCRPCGEGVRPTCVLCPNMGGAMKCTPSGHKWAHVSCVLWIPEVSIGCAEKMEPITKISGIPPSRWSLLCILCRERKGACIQCSVKTCKTAYHVTCAFKHGLEMRAIIEDENADDGVKLRSYCQKHSVNSKKEKTGSGSEEDEFKRKRRKDMTSEEKSQARAQRLHEIESEFDKHVSIKDISTHLLDVDQDAITYMYNYWKLKRRAGHNRPLLPPKADESDILSHRQEQADLDKMKMFVQLRQDLERVRNLCYMVSRREKLSRSFFRMREQTFHKQVAVLTEEGDLTEPTLSAVIEANHGPSIYDRLYSHPGAQDHSKDFENMLVRIAGSDDGKDKKKDVNGLVKTSANPYKKLYVNGSTRRSGSIYSGMSSEESAPELPRSSKGRRAIGSSTEDDIKTSVSTKKKISPGSKDKPVKVDRKKRVPPSRTLVDSSSEDDVKPELKKEKAPIRSKTLRALDREMSPRQSGTESDDLIPIRPSRNIKFPVDIYSDSSENSNPAKIEEFNEDRSPNATNDSQQPLPRTKAAMKEFVPFPKTEKEKVCPSKRGRKPSSAKMQYSDDEAKKENIKYSKTKDYPSDLIVPQRQAAKKASEKIQSTKTKDSEPGVESKPPTPFEESKIKPRIKAKTKEIPSKDINKKKNLSSESLDQDKEDKDSLDTIAYVPQRQAAKKAAAHIKSGLGTKPERSNTDDETTSNKSVSKISDKSSETSKKSPKKDDDKSKSSSRSSSSSSSNSSSSSYSSSSDTDDAASESSKADSIPKPTQVRHPSLFSPAVSRPGVDLPFLDKVSRPLSSSSASSDSDVQKATTRIIRSPSPEALSTRRKSTSIQSDVSLHKAPDKKLKTSERASESRVPSPTPEGKEPIRAARTRTRSIAASGNLPNKRDAGPRKSTRDDSSHDARVKHPREVSKPSQLPFAKRKKDETLRKKSITEDTKDEHKQKSPKSQSIDESDEDSKHETSQRETSKHETSKHETSKHEPCKHETSKHETSKPRRISLSSRRASTVNRRASVKEITSPLKETHDLKSKEEIIEKIDIKSPLPKHKSESPKKSFSPTKKPKQDEIRPMEKSESFRSEHKSWYSTKTAQSPGHQPAVVEKFGDTEKYLTDDKFDSDLTEKSSLKMIAKIQANLNENMMIQSPKTPMDATTHNIEPMDLETPQIDHKQAKIAPTTETEKKFDFSAMRAQYSTFMRDRMHVDTVKANQPSKVTTEKAAAPANTYPNRSIFSPQAKDTPCNDLFEFGNNILAVDDSVSDGFTNEEIIKPFSFTSEFLFKEDSKEGGGVQETINLVQKLRMTLKSKQEENADKENAEALKLEKESFVESEEKKEIQEVEEKKPESPPSPTESIYDPKSQPSVKSANPSIDSSEEIQVDDPIAEDEQRPITPEPIQESVSQEKWQHEHQIPPPPEPQRVIQEDNHSDYMERRYDEHPRFQIEQHLRRHSIMERLHVARHEQDNISRKSDDSCIVVDQQFNRDEQDNTLQESAILHNYENNNSMAQSDCATISSPYRERMESKWGESKITHRRSSASSTNSENSVSSQKMPPQMLEPPQAHQANIIREMDYTTLPPLPPYSCSMEPIPYGTYSEASPFITHSTVSLFQPAPHSSTSIPMVSPGAGLYPPNLVIPYSSTILPPLTKSFTTMCAAFTTSSQNMALTTAMIAPPTPKPSSPRDDDNIDLTTEKSYSIQASPTPSADSFNDASSTRCVISKLSNESNDTICTQSTQESQKSINKPTRTSTRLISSKSPAKSPGFSPKRAESVKSNTSKRSTSSKGSRGRGRGRSKARGGSSMHGFAAGNVDYLGNSLHSKLVGTVYELDFDEETANDGVDLKAMRERRRSVDVHERKTENSFKDSSSPHLSSPNNKRIPPPSVEPKDLRPPSPKSEVQNSEGSPHSRSSSEHTQFSIVQPVLPGPVDMRRYQPFEIPVPAREPLDTFVPNIRTQTLQEIDEEMDKELQTALMSNNSNPDASPNKSRDSPVPGKVDPPTPYTPESPLPKVSLSDSRNQLKVKIKGPFLDKNYSTSSVQPVVPQPAPPVYEPPPGILGTPSAVASATSAMLSGTSNLRRMRKKELLRQYCAQDMNMDEPTFNPIMGTVQPPVHQSPLSRTIITIPKAVASMTTIPTREDYKAVVDANMEKKKRKATAIRHFDSMNDDLETSDEINLPSFSGVLNQPVPSRKGRGRASVKPTRPPAAPKLKIKIGSSFVQPVTNDEPEPPQLRPPKKRLTSIPKPSFEALRRESMKYRRKVMADFEEGKKEKKHKPKSDKSERRKKKKDKKAEKKLQVVNESENANKLIIKITRKKEGETSESGLKPPPVPVDPFEYDPSAPDPLAIDPPSSGDFGALRKVRTSKVTPIRLKLSRSSAGSGYVMQDSDVQSGTPQPLLPPQPPAR